MIALTDGQQLVFSIVGLVAVVVFAVLPASRHPYRHHDGSKRRLLEELRRHD